MRPAANMTSHLKRCQRFQSQLAALQDRILSPASNVFTRSGQLHAFPSLRYAVAASATKPKLTPQSLDDALVERANESNKSVESVADDLIRKVSSGNATRSRSIPVTPNKMKLRSPIPSPPPSIVQPQQQQLQPPGPTWVRTEFDKLLVAQPDVNGVFNTAQAALDRSEMTSQRVASVLVVLVRLLKSGERSHISSADDSGSDADLRLYIRSHATLDRLMQVLKEDGFHLSHAILMASLEAAMTIGLPANHFAVESLQNELLWRARKLTPHLLIKVAAFQSRFCDTNLQRRVLDEVYRLLRRRCVEITNPKEILSVLNFANDRLPAEIRCLFEDRCATLCDDFSLEDCIQALSSLSSHGRRSLPLLKALSATILQFDKILPLKSAVDIGHALANLTFYNEMVMQKIIESMRLDINWINSNAKSSQTGGRLSAASKAQFVLNSTTNLFTIFGKLQYRDQEAIQLLTEKLRENKTHAAVGDWAAFVLACARIAPQDEAMIGDLLDDAIAVLRRGQANTTPKQCLDIVCSLCELSHAPTDFVFDTLRAGVAPLLKDETSPTRANTIRCKLANIAAYAALEIETSDDGNKSLIEKSIIDRCLLASPQELVGSRARDRLVGLIRQTLNTFAPQNRYVSFNTGYQLGYSTIVGEMIMSTTTGEPILLTTTDAPRQLTVKPGGANDTTANNNVPIMVLAWDYSDYAWPTGQLLGVHVKAVEHFERLGFAVAQIGYKEFNSLTTDVARVRHVKQRINEAVQFHLKNSGLHDPATASSLFTDDVTPSFAAAVETTTPKLKIDADFPVNRDGRKPPTFDEAVEEIDEKNSITR